jgi:DNA-binding beta-propeller fold protein YncE
LFDEQFRVPTPIELRGLTVKLGRRAVSSITGLWLALAGCGPSAATAGRLTLFYLDVTGGRVMTSDAQAPAARVLVPSAGQGPDGVAVDVAGGHVYWTGMGNPSANDGFIRRADLVGSNVTTLVPAGGTYTPKQMRLDVAGGKMYWSDREGMRVMRASLDGSNVEALVTTGQTDADRMDQSRWCVGIALDLGAGYIYWSQKGPSNGGAGSLRRAPLALPAGQTSVTRTDIEVLYDKLPEPIDIDLDLAAGDIYWTDRADNTVSRAPIQIPAGATAATRTDRQILVTGVATAIGVALDLPHGQLYYTSGANGALGRANLDGSQNDALIPMAGNLTGIALGLLP